jgi:hypothetical protein
MAGKTPQQIERDRVDAYMAKKLAERRAGAKQPMPKQYPLGISLMGKRFENLYDALGSEPIVEPKRKK